MLRQVIHDLYDEWLWIDGRLTEIDRQLVMLCRQIEAARRIATIPGIGPATATASDGSAFGRGRDFAAWLGLVPHQQSTGAHSRLLGISKRGNSYLRYLFIHCAGSVHRVLDRERSALGRWVGRLERRAIATSCWSPSPPNWRGSPGRCCGTGANSIFAWLAR